MIGFPNFAKFTKFDFTPFSFITFILKNFFFNTNSKYIVVKVIYKRNEEKSTIIYRDMQFHHSKQIYVFLPWLKYFAKYTNLQQDLVQYKTYINALNKYIYPE